MLQELLDKYKLKLDDLNAAERETLFGWVKVMADKQITLDDVRTRMGDLITAVQAELAGIEEPKHFWSWLFQAKRDVYLKARLKNYLMLQDFLTSPEKAKKWVEQQVSSLGK